MKTVLIKGLGLIGSSLARAIKQAHPDYQVLASDINQQALQYAITNQIIDQAVDGFDEGNQADVIILASPVSQIVKDLRALAHLNLKNDVIVTDVGSTKQTVMQAAQELTAQGISFVGGHPMAGSHLTGVQAGRADLIKGAYYFLMRDSQPAARHAIQDLLSGTQAKWLELTASEHDQLVAQLSHIPHVLAAALVEQAQQTCGEKIKVAAGGFKSVTRIAAADPTMWSAILLNNQQPILNQLHDYIDRLTEVSQLIEKGDRQQLFDFFAQAQQIRWGLDDQKG